MKYVCEICGWVYDEDEGCPESGIAPGTKWEDVPGDFECPVCYVGKDQFSESDDGDQLLLMADKKRGIALIDENSISVPDKLWETAKEASEDEHSDG